VTSEVAEVEIGKASYVILNPTNGSWFSKEILPLAHFKSSGFVHKVGTFNGNYSRIRLVLSECSFGLEICELRGEIFSVHVITERIATDLATGLTALAKEYMTTNSKFNFVLQNHHFYHPFHQNKVNLLSNLPTELRIKLRNELKFRLQLQGWKVNGIGTAEFDACECQAQQRLGTDTQNDHVASGSRKRKPPGVDEND